MFRLCILATVMYYKLNKLLIKFIIQPDDGQYKGPKHEILCTILCENI